ncbi:MAG TPA: hypothetical protein VGG10_09710 [Rhizomicrobium sp.]|jgi:hypothetical protein
MKRTSILTAALAVVLMTGTTALAQSTPDNSSDNSMATSGTTAAPPAGYHHHRSNMSNTNARSCASEFSDGNHRVSQSDTNGTTDGNALASNAPAQPGENCTNQIYPGPR